MELQVNARFDRLDFFQEVGAYCLKIVGNEGFLEYFIKPEDGETLEDMGDIPVVDREFMMQSEYELYIRWLCKDIEPL